VIAGNATMAVLVDVDGSVKAWGDAGNPHDLSMGDGVIKRGLRIMAPRAVPGLTHAVSAAVGGYQVLILLEDGTVLGWGPINMSTPAGDKPYSVVPIPLFKLRLGGED